MTSRELEVTSQPSEDGTSLSLVFPNRSFNIALLSVCFIDRLSPQSPWDRTGRFPPKLAWTSRRLSPFVPAARSSIYLALHLSARLCARGRAHKGRSGPPRVILCQLRAKHGRKKKKRCRAADCPLTETACSSAPGNKWLRWLIFLPSTIYNCLLCMCAGWKKNIIYRGTEFSSASSLPWKAACPAEVPSTLPGGSSAAGWLFDEGAELNRRAGGRQGGRDKKKAINLAESDRASANTSTLNSLSHHPPPTKKKKKKKKKSAGRRVGPAAGPTFHTVLRFQRAACAESRTGPPPANLLCSFSRQKINEAFWSLRWLGGWRVGGEGVQCFHRVYDTPGFSQVFGEELNEAEGETFVPSPRLLSSLLYLWLWSCCLYPPSLPPLLSPPSSWCQVALCLLLLSISFHLWALQFQPVPLSRIRKAADAGAELSVENLQTLSHTHLIAHTYSCISLSGFLIRPPSFVYSGWCK